MTERINERGNIAEKFLEIREEFVEPEYFIGGLPATLIHHTNRRMEIHHPVCPEIDLDSNDFDQSECKTYRVVVIRVCCLLAHENRARAVGSSSRTPSESGAQMDSQGFRPTRNSSLQNFTEIGEAQR